VPGDNSQAVGMALSTALLLLPTLSLVASRGCPSLNEVDIFRNMTEEWSPDVVPSFEFIGGRWYSEPGEVIPELSCKGQFKEALSMEGDEHPSGDGEPMGSLLIYPGCKVYLFEEPGYEGEFVEYTGPAVMSHPKYLFGWACGDRDDPMLCPRSYLWSCQQQFPSCQPEDGWDTVTTLDNSQSNNPTTFTFAQQIGITWGHSETEGGSISTAIKNSFTVGMSCFFEWSYTFDVTLTTTFNWSQQDSMTWSDVKTYTVSQTVPAGEKVEIMAAVGYCGDNKIETRMFKVVSSRTGEVLEYRNME